MAEVTDTEGDMYDEALKRLGRQAKPYENAYGVYESQLTNTRQAYERMAAQARVNKALAELAGRRSDSAAGITAKAAGRTIGQRNDNSLRNTLGGVNRQYKDYRANAQHALDKLDIQQAAQEASLDSSRAAQEGAGRLSQERFEADIGLQQDYLKLNKDNSDFNKAYQLYLRRYFDPGRFKKMTGIKIKKLPVPRRPPNILADLKKTLNEQGLLLNGKTPKQSTADDWIDYLSAHKAEMVKKYGEDQYNTAISYYSLKSYDAQFGGLSQFIKPLDDMIGLLGTDKEPGVYEFFNDFYAPLDLAWDEILSQGSG